ncbi:hypothetical protein NEOLEDRAFT_1151583, partial [Neolentinus lepideus HHB14362 ss-1]
STIDLDGNSAAVPSDSECDEGEDTDGEVSSKSQSMKPGNKSKAVRENAAPRREKKKTPARPGTSVPAPAPATQSKKFKPDFQEVAKAEELTRQRELELQIEQTKLTLEKTKANLELRKEKTKIKGDLARLRMEQEHQRRMMKYTQVPGPMPLFQPGITHPGSTTSASFDTLVMGGGQPGVIPQNHASSSSMSSGTLSSNLFSAGVHPQGFALASTRASTPYSSDGYELAAASSDVVFGCSSSEDPFTEEQQIEDGMHLGVF